jgi:hypothetical protein
VTVFHLLFRPDAYNFLQKCLTEGSRHPFNLLVENPLIKRSRETLVQWVTEDLKGIISKKEREHLNTSPEVIKEKKKSKKLATAEDIDEDMAGGDLKQ